MRPNTIYDALEGLIICEPDRLETGCWEWSKGKTKGGYGHMSMDGKKQYVHRMVYEHYKGEIPEGLELDHLCKNRKCANPEHLEIVDRRTNALRGDGPRLLGERQRAKTHCPYNHPYNEENTFVRPNGKRECRICMRERTRRQREICKIS